MIDFTRRRFLFGLAAAPLAIPAVTHFVMPKWEPVVTGARLMTISAAEKMVNPPLIAYQASPDGCTWHDIKPGDITYLPDGALTFSIPGATRNLRITATITSGMKIT